ncbi:MAG: glycosyltransferase family 2 protein [Fibrobacter sp.]|nr:glycosyltransferase family 2 protein [Fibrobacter sp.]
MKISLIIPCYNEQEVLHKLYDRVTPVLEKTGDDYEVILIDDGSRDNSLSIMEEFHERNSKWKYLSFSRNFGHQTAVSAGIFYCSGDCAVIIDADLQDPPELIPDLICKWKEGFKVVYAVRKKRKEGIVKRFCYSAFYRLLAKSASISIPLDSGDFCLMDRVVLNRIKSMPESNRFIRGMRAWVGFKQIGIEYERDARAAGKPQYTFSKLLRLAFDGIFSFSTMPLRMTAVFGFIISFFSFIFAAYSLVQRIFADFFMQYNFKLVPGFATTIVSIFFLGGVQLICLGVIGEYIGRVYDEVKRRPLWVISKASGIDTEE